MKALWFFWSFLMLCINNPQSSPAIVHCLNQRYWRLLHEIDRNQYLPVAENIDAGHRFRDPTPEHTVSGHSFVSYPLAFNIPLISQNRHSRFHKGKFTRYICLLKTQSLDNSSHISIDLFCVCSLRPGRVIAINLFWMNFTALINLNSVCWIWIWWWYGCYSYSRPEMKPNVSISSFCFNEIHSLIICSAYCSLNMLYCKCLKACFSVSNFQIKMLNGRG